MKRMSASLLRGDAAANGSVHMQWRKNRLQQHKELMYKRTDLKQFGSITAVWGEKYIIFPTK